MEFRESVALWLRAPWDSGVCRALGSGVCRTLAQGSMKPWAQGGARRALSGACHGQAVCGPPTLPGIFKALFQAPRFTKPAVPSLGSLTGSNATSRSRDPARHPLDENVLPASYSYSNFLTKARAGRMNNAFLCIRTRSWQRRRRTAQTHSWGFGLLLRPIKPGRFVSRVTNR